MNDNYLIKRVLNFDFIFDKFGALFIKQTRTLLIADLHIGKSTSININGGIIPEYDNLETLNNLDKVIDKYRPTKVISLGDNFHDNFSIMNISSSNLKKINKITKKADFLWINGNHDDNMIGKEKVGGLFLKTFHDTQFMYTHKKSNKDLSKYEFSGHYHPKVSLKVNNSKFYYKCFILSRKFCILPSFGYYTGGLDVNSKTIKKIINECVDLIIIGKEKIIIKSLNYDTH